MGIVSQEPVLFATSIANNIKLGAKYGADNEITQKQLETAAKEANCYDFIVNLPQVGLYSCGHVLAGIPCPLFAVCLSEL